MPSEVVQEAVTAVNLGGVRWRWATPAREPYADRARDGPSRPAGEGRVCILPVRDAGFAAERLMRLEVGGVTGAAERRPSSGWTRCRSPRNHSGFSFAACSKEAFG